MIENIPTEKLYDEKYIEIMSKIEKLRSLILKHKFSLSLAGTGSKFYSICDIILEPLKESKLKVPINYFLIKLRSYLIQMKMIQTSYVNYVWTRDVILSSTFPAPVRRVEYPWAVENSQLKKGMKILDVGSGVSMLPIYLASEGYDVYSIDNDDTIIKKVCPKLSEWCKTKIQFSIGDATKINFEDNYFDRVFCISVLEHLEEEVGNINQRDFHKKNLDIKAINEMLRVLKPNGLLILTLDWSENPSDFRSYDINDIYDRLLQNVKHLLVENKKPKVDWNVLKEKHLAAEKEFPPYSYLVEGWAMGIILKKQ